MTGKTSDKTGTKSTDKIFLVEVILISKNVLGKPLSYFSSFRPVPGTMVKVPVRKKVATAIVLNSRDVQNAKTEIRQASFPLKKISKKNILEAGLSREFLDGAKEMAKYYATSPGIILATIIPKIFLDEPRLFLKLIKTKKKRAVGSTHKETLLLQMETEERFGQYRAIVRQCFARGKSVMFLVPTHLDIERAKKELSGGIIEFVHVCTLSDNKNKIKEMWNSAKTDPHPVLLITTPAGLSFQRQDLDTIIIERESSRAYRTLTRPYLNFKNFIEQYARLANIQLVLGDSVLSLETLWREKTGKYGENSLIRWRLPGASTSLVDKKCTQNKHGRFEILSDELKKLLEKAVIEVDQHSAPGRVFLFGARKGLSPTTVCGDCGTVLECLNCKAPVVLHRQRNLPIYICHACGARRESEILCNYCKSWKLIPLGIGTEEIARAVRELFPKTPVNIIDKDYAPTDHQAALIIRKFEKEGGILVGTELAFYHLESVPYSGIVSVDALFSIPDFSINERIFYIVSHLREMTKIESIIQTKNIGRQVLAWATQGNIIDFYLNEIEERKSLLYPPFSMFIKITVPKADSRIMELKKRFIKWNPDIFKDSLIMRLPREAWPDEELKEKLSLLPIEFSIRVDPESIL